MRLRGNRSVNPALDAGGILRAWREARSLGENHGTERFTAGLDQGTLLAADAPTAVLFSLIASAKRHSLNTWRHLRDVLIPLADLKPGELEQLLPDRWQQSPET